MVVWLKNNIARIAIIIARILAIAFVSAVFIGVCSAFAYLSYLMYNNSSNDNKTGIIVLIVLCLGPTAIFIAAV